MEFKGRQLGAGVVGAEVGSVMVIGVKKRNLACLDRLHYKGLEFRGQYGRQLSFYSLDV